MLAPGMACWTVVRFRPESLADYEDFVAVAGETSRGRVTLVAKRHPPRLTIDPVVDVGPVLVGGNVEFLRAVQERGAAAGSASGGREGLAGPNHASGFARRNRRPLAVRGAPRGLSDAVHLSGAVPGGRASWSWSKTPWRSCASGFAPPRVGAFTRNFRAVCDNGQVKTFAVTGVGTVLDVAVAAIDGRDVAAGELARVGDSYALAQSAPPPLRFRACEPGSVTRRVFAVRNATKVPVPFEWDLPDPDAEDDGDDDARAFSVTRPAPGSPGRRG